MNNNFDENTINNIKNMVDSGDINGAISQISPEMIQNFSKMLSQNQNGNSNGYSNSNSSGYQNNTSNNFANSFAQNNSNSNVNSNGNGNGNGNANNFDFSNIDMNAIMKMASNLNLNNSNRNDPRGNLLNALKPYMRDSKKGKMDNYMNLLNMAKMADIFKNNPNIIPNSNQEKH